MKRVFISRAIEEAGWFRKEIEKRGWVITGESLVQFDPVEFSWPQPGDWIFFTSKKGVQYFWEGINSSADSLDRFQLACMGKGTAEALARRIRKPDFTGEGQPSQVAQAFREVAAGQKVLFPIGTHSLRTIQRSLGQAIEGQDLVVYHNRKKSPLQPILADFYVLTSPMNVHALLENDMADRDQVFIAIGEKTADAMRTFGLQQIRIARVPSEAGLIEAIGEEVE